MSNIRLHRIWYGGHVHNYKRRRWMALSCTAVVRCVLAMMLLQNCPVTLASEFTSAENVINIGPKVAQILQSTEDLNLSSLMNSPAQTSFCNEIYSAFKTNSRVVDYPQPIVQTNDLNHPAMSRYQVCDSEENQENHAGAPGYFFTIPDEIGTTRFRIYRLELDGNTANGLEEIIYGENRRGFPGAHRIYAVIAVEKEGCRYGYGRSTYATGGGMARQSYDAIIRYRDNYYIYNLFELGGVKTKDSPVHAYISHLSSLRDKVVSDKDSRPILVCSWSTLH